MNFSRIKYNFYSITTALWVVVVFSLLFSCQSSVHEKFGVDVDPIELPRLHSLDVTTLISDSGITRYKIYTPEWNIFEKTGEPYWEFPLGVHFERFNESLVVDANIHADYAKFLEKQKIWELKGNVQATNIQGEMFETEQLFWNQNTEKIYSDSIITITQPDYIITGKGFESNQEMTKYQVKQTQGVIPVNEE